MSPTHDMIIDNSTGANVRADINNALAALVSNSSSSSEPSTKYAYQFWADTTTGILKIRNSANNAWVELLQLDGTLTLEDGSASTPALAFRDDLNTGIFSSAADKFNVATGGVERMELGSQTVFNESGADVDFRIEGDTDENLFRLDASTNRIGIGQSSPEGKLHIETGSSGATFSSDNSDLLILEHSDSVGLDLRSPAANSGNITFSDANARGQGRIAYEHNNDAFFFCTGGIANERMRIDSSGNVGIGTTTPDHVLDLGSSSAGRALTFSSFSNLFSEYSSGAFWLASNFYGNAGASGYKTGATGNFGAAAISVSATGGSSSSGIIQFFTNSNASKTAGDAFTPTERMRMDSSGFVGINTTSPQSLLTVQRGSLDSGSIMIGANYNGTGLANNSDKSGAIHAPMYDSDTYPKGVRLMGHYSSNTTTLLQLGGGTNSARSATSILFYTAADKSSNGSEKMRIDPSGNVGIGVGSPDSKLGIAGTGSDAATRISITDGSGKANVLGRYGNLSLQADEANAVSGSLMQFKVDGSERMRISGGVLSIGTTDNSVATNNVQGISIDGTNGYFAVNRTGNEAFGFGRSNDGQVGRFFNGGTNVGNITVGSSSTAYNTTMSDRSKKKNFEEWTEDTLEIFKNLNPQKFNYITENDSEKKTKGFIAQDLVDSFPEAYPVDDKDGKYWFNPSGMVVYLMKAIQELEAKVAALEAA